ncbi:asparagine synthase (glutamine-hydrolysing) [Sphingomonas sp. PP-F2F-A104-K0414]|uniref:asparagine synthase (glutamine-hydrolyzing) n=1 Tax=Sphingomonas sp. PP-F2F-A104-K0414 TaxID=2135661 RepID=UPI0010DBA0ED|nr:asparagine synthase (glutamine-hydrolyzing) [Sphingomonas sp. PP-F2F-A104-K0414]TCP98140.1 asparagine synthase (glutamine-hydrolysing) [Sphingomonas sp. PP-F2F-A104-K0414]
MLPSCEGSFVICGIAGLYARGGGVVSPRLITAQCDTILHRGPDDQGVITDGDFGFGMRRLSIIDIEGGHQPFHSPDGRYVLVFNGEIYNFRELRSELQALGRVFDSAGDTEVILAGYERWGDDVWARLDGMFAVAVWDTHARRLTLARDPIGIKPLYYTDQAAGFAFGSELKTLTLLPEMAFDVDHRALHDYFSFGHVRTPRSIYAQVRTLPPGHVMTVDASGPPTMRAYWTPAYHPAEPLSEAQWITRFRNEWLDTIGKQMVADVDVGAFLSGGVDSSAVVAAMAQVSDRPVRTFTIGFPDPRFDESPHAEAIARHLGCHHVTRTLELADAQAMLPEVQHCYDEPFADPSAVPTWYVSQIAAQEVKVALSGDGGDELFFGYKRHATERRIGALPAPLRHLARALDAVPTLPSRHANAVLQRWRKTTGSAALPNGIARFFAKTQITNEAFRREIFSAEFIAEEEGGIAALVAEYFPDPDAISTDTLEQFGLADLALNLPGAMLTKVDRASMAHSLEVRVPMLGQGMVDLALSMPADMKLHGKIGKYVIRQAIAPWLPEGILDRRKQGFQMPLAAWFAGDFGAYAEQLWRDSGVREQGIWRAGAVDKVFADHRAGRRDYSRFLYALAIYCLWWIGRPKAVTVRAE